MRCAKASVAKTNPGLFSDTGNRAKLTPSTLRQLTTLSQNPRSETAGHKKSGYSSACMKSRPIPQPV
jgi:hypothetical protein